MKENNQGFALIFGLVIMVVAGVLLTGLFFNTNTNLSITNNDVNSAYAKSLAETGLNRFQTMAVQSFRFYLDHWEEYDLTEEQKKEIKCDPTNLLALGLDTDREANNSNLRTLDLLANQPFEKAITLPNGVKGGYIITLTQKGTAIESTGYVGTNLASSNAKSKLRASFKAIKINNPYQNALFVGGQTGKISGNTAAYGSVHVMGNPANGEALDMRGKGAIYNNYHGSNSGSNTDISGAIENLTGIDPNSPPDLCSNLKVKHGDVKRSGGTPIGVEDLNVNDDIISNLAGVYVAGIIEDTDSHPPHTRNTDNYTSDMDVEMPEIPHDYPNDIADAVNINDCSEFASAISQGTGFTVANATPGAACSSGSGGSMIAWVDNAANCASFLNGNGVGINTVGGVLCVEGTINTGSNDLNFTDQASYQGKGTFRTGTANKKAHINIHTSIKPLNNDFPNGSALGLVSNGDINIKPKGQYDGVHNEHAFIAFAVNEIDVTHQVTVAGSLLAGTFRTTQVPNIAYVPDTDKVAKELTGLPQPSNVDEQPKLVITSYERR